jgi:hypothetical protein
MNDHLKLLADIHQSGSETMPPSYDILRSHLEKRQKEIGAKAFVEFAHVQTVAATIWGAERTSHFAMLLREARVSPKAPRKTTWEQTDALLSRLPDAWSPAMSAHIKISKGGKRVKGERIWSAAHSLNVIRALLRWSDFCAAAGCSLIPTGSILDSYAKSISKRATRRTVSDYIDRILSGLSIVAPGFQSASCDYVACDWAEQAAQDGATTKKGSQLVGATCLYDLGFESMDSARRRKVRGIHAAKDFRNGILLAIAAALPQRARALSALQFDKTLFLLDAYAIEIKIPATMLKLPEDRKDGEPFHRVFSSKKLSTALEEYRRAYRPLFDNGTFLFPSIMSPGASISEKQIGRLVGDMTQEAFGVRVSIHLVRDNVATEACEYLGSKGRGGAVLLGHSDEQTTQRHYDHSTGIATAQEFLALIDKQRRLSVNLNL